MLCFKNVEPSYGEPVEASLAIFDDESNGWRSLRENPLKKSQLFVKTFQFLYEAVKFTRKLAIADRIYWILGLAYFYTVLIT